MSFAFMIALFLFADLVVIILLGTKIIVPTSVYSFVIDSNIGNTYAIGRVLYTDFILPFQTAGVILFAAMIASIALTLRLRSDVKRQNVSNQISKSKENSLFLAKNNGKSGLDNLNYDD
jgi:NADH-quinone oxidoreductase subunit J